MKTLNIRDLDLDFEYILNECKEIEEPVCLIEDDNNSLVAMDAFCFEKIKYRRYLQLLIMESMINRLSDKKDVSINKSKELINALIDKK